MVSAGSLRSGEEARVNSPPTTKPESGEMIGLEGVGRLLWPFAAVTRRCVVIAGDWAAVPLLGASLP